MARALTSKIRIAYDAQERFTAIVRPRELVKWEEAGIVDKIIRAAGGVDLTRDIVVKRPARRRSRLAGSVEDDDATKSDLKSAQAE
jgi:hypothetical protein